ncbi:MAG: bile acid:sodium symporter family protein [Planctomycetota bacterium]
MRKTIRISMGKLQELRTTFTRSPLLIALLVTSGLAYGWPRFTTSSDPFRLSSEGLLTLVGLTMFCLGLVLTAEEMSELRRRPATVLLGVVLQCTLMPALAWSVVQALSLEGDLALGVVLTGCVPGAMASNVLTMTARGNVSYSVSLTTVATLLSPLTVPAALTLVTGMQAGEQAFDPGRTAMMLGVTVVGPVVLGFASKQWFPFLRPLASRVASPVASIALLWIIASVVAGNRDRLSQIQWQMLLALLLVNLLGYLGGFLVGKTAKLPDAMTRALTLEVGMQNAGLGTALAASLLGSDSIAQVPTAVYTFGCMLTGTLLAALFGRIALANGGSPLDDATSD